ncbi:High-affinity nicotinic acid transporter [Pseudocercospora fuligena]|uniref:High-affinity nicotinic acid transporter n=1 Tax=Pseudocercospora fuligena TaxID=685502 RepID=A0A8H6VH12_9PEZI|nr:High-affinity nicotinic acid transporter [Pseudocercospora fuligena]
MLDTPSDDESEYELQKVHRSSLEETPATMTPAARERHQNDEDERERQPLNAGGYHTTSTLALGAGEQDTVNRRTVRKLDAILLPFLALLFLLNSLDKSNIGNAETAGFTFDTGLSRKDVNTSMAVFFFVFVLLQPVGAALGRRYGMQRYVPTCMSLWGLTTILHIFVRKRWHLILLRVMIATLESGFYPTTVSYMSLFYTKYEFAVRLGFFYGMTAVSGVVGGILSWGIFSEFPGHDHDDDGPSLPPSTLDVPADHGWKSWEVLFLIEGCMTMTVALIGFLWLPRSADSAWFLNSEERSWAEARMRQDTISSHEAKSAINEGPIHEEPFEEVEIDPDDHADSGTDESDHDRLLAGSTRNGRRRMSSVVSAMSITADSGLSRQDILSAVFSYKIWYLLICNILSAIPATAFGVLLPILVKELSPSLNLSPAASNLLSAPPFAFGAIVLFIFTAWSDRSRTRIVPILSGLVLLLAGLAMTILSPMNNYWLRYASLCVLLSGSFIASPLTVAWLANNTPEQGKRAILLGINGWGNLAGVFMQILFTPKDKDRGYIRSFTVLLVCSLASFVGFVFFRTLLLRENRFRDNVLRGWSEEEKEREELLGDVPAPEHFGHRLAKRVGILAFASRLDLEDGRRGDEKLTFRYSM